MHFLIMEYVDGVSLQHLVEKGGPLDVVRAAHYVAQAAQGLQYAHESGLVHRDVKPANLLVDRLGTVKVLDLGLARLMRDDNDKLTKQYNENAILGTADYLAPEQAQDSHQVDIRADVYSLGCTFYFLLTGRTPFEGGNVLDKLRWHQMRQPQSVRRLRPDVPETLAAVVEKMMAKDPAQRYQTPWDVVKDLTPWTAIPIPPPVPEELPRRGFATRESQPADSSGTLAAGGMSTVPSLRKDLDQTMPDLPVLAHLPPIARGPDTSVPGLFRRKPRRWLAWREWLLVATCMLTAASVCLVRGCGSSVGPRTVSLR